MLLCSDLAVEELTLAATLEEAPVSRREVQIEGELEGRRLHSRFVNHHHLWYLVGSWSS